MEICNVRDIIEQIFGENSGVMLVEAPVSHITNAHVSPAAGIAIEVGCIKVLKGFERCTVSSKPLENKPVVFGALRKFVSHNFRVTRRL